MSLKIVPNHVAIIMDGNGRWAKARRRPRFFGHIRGCSVVSEITEEAAELGLKSLTLYAFSTENWKRPQGEIDILFKLFEKFLKKEQKKMLKNGIKLSYIGDLSILPTHIQKLAREIAENTKHGTKMNLVLAINYGARAELVRAFNMLSSSGKKEITEEDISASVWNPSSVDLDLLIRTGGDRRISNFLLWQASYAELYFEEKMWPDFTREDFRKIVLDFSHRERRFGAVEPLRVEVSP